ncbi:hypothetical protein quinque_008141 [Culex quinquefasciatus]
MKTFVSVRSSPLPSPKQTTSILKPTGSIRKGGDRRVTMISASDSDGKLSPTFIEILNENLNRRSSVSVRSSPLPSPKQTTSILKPTGSIRKGGDRRVTMISASDSDGKLSPTFIEILNENLNRRSSVRRQFSMSEKSEPDNSL